MKVLLQDFVPYDESVQWLIHDAYFADRGIGAWGEESRNEQSCGRRDSDSGH